MAQPANEEKLPFPLLLRPHAMVDMYRMQRTSSKGREGSEIGPWNQARQRSPRARAHEGRGPSRAENQGSRLRSLRAFPLSSPEPHEKKERGYLLSPRTAGGRLFTSLPACVISSLPSSPLRRGQRQGLRPRGRHRGLRRQGRHQRLQERRPPLPLARARPRPWRT